MLVDALDFNVESTSLCSNFLVLEFETKERACQLGCGRRSHAGLAIRQLALQTLALAEVIPIPQDSRPYYACVLHLFISVYLT
jgi:hypothetical protein